MMNNIDSTLQNLRPRQTAAANHLSPTSLSSSAPAASSIGQEIWNQTMWRLIDKEMGLRYCEKYSYQPDDDPFDGDEGAIWSIHYFFFNKEKKRVCYVYLRGFSVISHSPVSAATTLLRSNPVPRQSSSLSAGEGAGKRASYWLGNDLLQRGIDTTSFGDDDDDEALPDDDEVEIPFMDLDDIRSHLVDGRYSDTIDEDDEEYEEDSWKAAQCVRGLSEEIGDSMELDL
jgi:hypothetical protein